MEHSLPTFGSLADRWRAATLVAGAVAALELVVIVVLVAVLAGKSLTARGRHEAKTAPAHVPVQRPRPKPRVPATKLPRAKTSVLVLNGNGRTGAAGLMASLVRARGYRIGGVGNAARSDYGRSVVMYRNGFQGEAARLAKDMHVRIVGPLDGLSRRTLGRAHLALVVGR